MRYELSTLRRKARMEKKAMMAEKQLQQQQLMLQNPSGNLVLSERSASASSAAPALRAVPAAASLVQLVHIVMPPHANHMNTMFGGILMEWAEEASRLSVHRLIHATTHGAPPQNLKSLVKKFEHLGAGASAASPAAKRWFHLSTVCANHRKFCFCLLSHDAPRSYVDGISFLAPAQVQCSCRSKSRFFDCLRLCSPRSPAGRRPRANDGASVQVGATTQPDPSHTHPSRLPHASSQILWRFCGGRSPCRIERRDGPQADDKRWLLLCRGHR